MATTAVPAQSGGGSLRQRRKGTSPAPQAVGSVFRDEISTLAKVNARARKPSEVEYHVGFVVMTALAFLTRFWGISHPNEVVFDEVHFGKVSRAITEQEATRAGP